MDGRSAFWILVGTALLSGSSEAVAAKRDSVPKIVGGTAVSSGEVPWTVAIINRDTSFQYCGGTLIHPEWVVTAGHCMEGEAASNVSVVAGRLNLADSGSGEVVDASQVIMHSGYNSSTLENDIALIHLSSSVSAVSTTVSVLDSPVENTYWVAGSLSEAAGWGDTSEGGSSSDQLLKVELPIISASTCSADGADTNFHIFAGETGKDTCQGDSGGPLYVKDFTNTYSILAGITSYGTGCARPDTYGKYTRVAQYTDWIESNAGITLQKASNSNVPALSLHSLAGIVLLMGLALTISSRRRRVRPRIG